ncbi:flavin reductase family protein [Salinicola aestuarinus]|uniref:flavin reductase family protein n=1 Tax=Salinicola aestuarinus TaxID=1949082 RepID=UPI00165F8134|nr:flavin reductase family protein [Salinicola aestuarinus]
MTTHFYEPANGHGLAHNPFKAIVGPRPIGWISSRDRQGNLNLAPYSFFNAFADAPPIIGFASAGYKDSVRNIEQTGEFCWHLATRALGEAMNQSAATVEPDVDEFDLAALTATPSSVIDVPHVKEAQVVFECRLSQCLRLTSAAGESMDNWLVLGEVVGVHIDTALIDDGVYQTAAARPILRGGGPGDYFEISNEALFEMRRPS